MKEFTNLNLNLSKKNKVVNIMVFQLNSLKQKGEEECEQCSHGEFEQSFLKITFSTSSSAIIIS